MKTPIKKIVIAAMFASLICVATMLIKIPSPLKGYLNLGDGIVLLSGWLLSPFYGFMAAGVGSALADIFSGYAIYSPATFIIKGIMSIAAYYIYKVLCKKHSDSFAVIISGLISEATMVLGYFIFEGILYGFSPSLVNIPANAMQGIVGITLGAVLIKVFKKNNIL